jgi:pSer/pThr/pTyr-binding forkhead associated (FHA) protein
MAKITVKIHGQVVSELQLQPGREHFAGRGTTCDITLAQERGISRQHIQFFEQNGGWSVQLISKYGGLVYLGQAVDQIDLRGELNFSVPPYEFYFNELDSGEVNHSGSTHELSSPNESKRIFSPPANLIENPIASPDYYEASNLDATSAGVQQLIAYLRINNHTTRIEEVFKLEGHLWTAGRHPSSEIVINDSAISRKHFDISRTESGYFITDHGSSNGTKLNGEKIEPNKACPLVSGDVISIRNIEILFEVHDAQYEKHLQAANENANALVAYEDHDPFKIHEAPADKFLSPQVYSSSAMRADNLTTPQPWYKKHNLKPIHYVIGVLAIIFVALLFTTQEQPKQIDVASKGEPGKLKPIEELSSEKKKEVIDIFNLAQTYYVQRKYVLCVSQAEKLHSLVAFYSNSRELETLCKQAIELEEIQANKRRKEEARAEVENRILQAVGECRAQMTAKTTSAEIDACLQEAIQLSPQHGLILALQNDVRVQENAAQEKLENERARAEHLSRGRSLFAKAMATYRRGQLKTAMTELRRFLAGSYNLPNEKSEARKTLNIITRTLDAQLSEQVAACKSAFEKGALKDAIIACDRVLKESPNNETARANKNNALSQLKREMKNIYEDSSLEESMGNIELAKEKWQKILDTSVPEDDYYKKAKQKLKKYGIGM